MTAKQLPTPKGLTIGAVAVVLILTPALLTSAFMPAASAVPAPRPVVHGTGFSMDKVSKSADAFFERVGEWTQSVGHGSATD